jgi:cytochrome c6
MVAGNCLFRMTSMLVAGITAAFAVTAAESTVVADPAQDFLVSCAACHLPTGRGVPPIFPALDGNALVNGDPAALVEVVLAGRNGMPSFRNDLTDQQLAAVISYVRRSWSNDKPPVNAEYIAKIRVLTRNEKVAIRVMAN